MRRRIPPVAWLVAGAALPFAASLLGFIASARESLLTDPAQYIEVLQREGSSSTLVSLPAWKHVLARAPLCRDADAIVIGSSRVREIDRTVTGVPTCNLYIDGLATGGFLRLARALPAVAFARPPVVYVGVDHFWLWSNDTDPIEDVELELVDVSPALWRGWRVARTLTFFQWRDVVEAVRRYRQGVVPFARRQSVWYPDGHLFHPLYYGEKAAGHHPVFSHEEVVVAAEAVFGTHRVRAGDVQRLGDGVRLLHAKGYTVRLFWNPVSPEHTVVASTRYGTAFRAAIAAVDRLAASLPLERYVPAADTLDPSRFGCTGQDYFDTTHVDVDCIRRVFAGVFASRLTAAR